MLGRRTIQLSLLVGGMLAWTSICAAQSAFFPLERINDQTTDQWVTIQCSTSATSMSGFTPVTTTGPVINDAFNDTDSVNESDSSGAISGNTSASSTASAAAMSLPLSGTYAAVAESTIGLLGMWQLAVVGMGGGWTANAVAGGGQEEFQVLANSTYPSITSGTLNSMLVLDASIDTGFNGGVSASAGSSTITVTVVGGGGIVSGSVAGYGSVMEYGATGGTFSGTESISVGDTSGTQVAGNVGSGGQTGNSGSASVSATASAWVSYP